MLYFFIFSLSKNWKNQFLMKMIWTVFFFGALILLLIVEGYYYSFKNLEGDKTLYDFYKDDIINYIEKVNNEWKDIIIFKFDEKSKKLFAI